MPVPGNPADGSLPVTVDAAGDASVCLDRWLIEAGAAAVIMTAANATAVLIMYRWRS